MNSDGSRLPPGPGEVSAQAVVIEGATHTGKPCRIVDNTGSIARTELQAVLETLISDRRFGVSGRSAGGSNTIPLDRPAYGHIQFGDRLYRILLFRYEARIEPF